ncbi:uncharacterized protein LOC122089723 [Macadamia integrifolia]|uniref:uncharacterized protein LOC122089723 n=1 Tax=Macadamia integrifolia TaxID=60698 RepID=UPI001C4FC476|nr:uncharacterized protein LOC122089723 [Macadamia integrifolia]
MAVWEFAVLGTQKMRAPRIRRLRKVNESCHCKLVWQIKYEDSMMAYFFHARFDNSDGSMKGGYKSSSVWTGIKKVWDFVSSNEKWAIGDGERTLFCHDKWLGSSSIANMSSLNHSLFQDLDTKVGAFIKEGKWVFPPVSSSFIKEIFDKVGKLPISLGFSKDICSLENFSMKSSWEGLRQSQPKVGWLKLIWGHYLQPRQSVFGWRLLQGKLPCDDKIKARGILFPSRCELCMIEEESINHLFLECKCVRYLWSSFSSIFGATFTSYCSSMVLSKWWSQKSRVLGLKDALWAGYILIPYFIWLKRNSRRFNSVSRNFRQIFNSILGKLHRMSPSMKGRVASVFDLVCSRNEILENLALEVSSETVAQE